MATSITTIQAADLITDSRADINNNFDSLLVNKLETSVLDTDTTLAANSDSKVPTQKAVKAYVDAGGNVNATETTKGIVEIATAAEVAAGTATGATGASLVVTPDNLPRTTQIVYDVADSPATWTKDTGLKRIKVQAWGAGGGGAGGVANSSGGGAGGGYVEWLFEASELGATETVTIGAGGAGGANAAGSTGGTTSFGSLLSVYGGGGGGYGNSAINGGSGGNGLSGGQGFADAGSGTYTAGDSNQKLGSTGGGAGGWASDTAGVCVAGGSSIYGGAGGGAAINGGTAQSGGTSQFGGAGGAATSASGGIGTAGSVPSGGGGGANNVGGGTGGAGGAGRVIVTEYYV